MGRGLQRAVNDADPTAQRLRGGTRSRAAASHLPDAGFRRVANLTGGILRWRDDVDPELPRY
jgi:adenylyltransferase/sulfurtransferase